MRTFVIKGRFYKDKCFPGLNNLLAEAGRSPYCYNSIKKKYEHIALLAIRSQLRGWEAQGLITMHFEFGEPKKGQKRDYDNIVAAARKIINDAMTKSGKIKDDNPSYLGYGTNKFVYTSEEPYILVTIEEVGTPVSCP